MSPQVSSASKTERLLNLLIMLLVQRNYVSKERIRAILYAEASDDAFEKSSSATRTSCAASGSSSK